MKHGKKIKLALISTAAISILHSTNAVSSSSILDKNTLDNANKKAKISTSKDDAEASSSPDQIINSVVNSVVNNNFENAPKWLKRMEIEHQISTDGKPQVGVTTVQPIFENGSDFIFNQSRIAYGNDARTTVNVGLGYRHLTEDEKVLYGANYFYDFQGPYGHKRSGLGAELRSASFEINSNYYLPHSGWRDAGTIYEEKALEGFDTELGIQTPYIPWAWWYAKGYQYHSELNKSQDITGAQYSVRLRPFENISVEAGHNNNNRASANNFISMQYRIGFNDPNTISKKKSIFSKTPFEYGESMKERVYDKIRRSNNITVERRVKGAAGGGAGGTANVIVAVGS
jgi:hypothetical protein